MKRLIRKFKLFLYRKLGDEGISMMGIAGMVIVILLIMFIALIVISLPLMWLWNLLMPVIFKLTEITLWQSMGLFLLSFILFGVRLRLPRKK